MDVTQLTSEGRAQWSIRTGSTRDIPALLDLWRRAENLPSATDNPESLTVLLEHDEEFLMVAEREEVLVGSLIIGWDGWRGNFYRLAVDPSARREGLGRALVAEGEHRLRRRGAVRLAAVVAKTEDVAMAFWRGIGYEQEVDETRFVRVF